MLGEYAKSNNTWGTRIGCILGADVSPPAFAAREGDRYSYFTFRYPSARVQLSKFWAVYDNYYLGSRSDISPSSHYAYNPIRQYSF